MVAGIHIVQKRRPGKDSLFYVYAWRGGPLIERTEGKRPKVDAKLMDKAAEARRKRTQSTDDTIAGLAALFRSSADWLRLSKSQQTTYTTWLGRIEEKFGRAPLSVFADRRVRADVLEWRDQWASQPRSADVAITTFSRLMSFGYDRGMLPGNVLSGIERLYEADRSDVIWEAHHLATFRPHAAVEVQEAMDLALLTGLRRGDLLSLPWSAVGEFAILWRTAKSGRRAFVTIPLLDGVTTILETIKARHAAVMTARRPDKRKPLPDTILSNSRWEPWTASGFGSRFNDAKLASKVERNFHDLRGTFATRCMMAGLTDQQIADILGWRSEEVAVIRSKYVDQARVVVELGKRIAATKIEGV